VGKNGHGKSSIALVLEEVLFNTNSKKIKKADVLNRYTKDKNYWIELDFEKDGNEYRVVTKRTAASGTVSLLCNGDDISSHTATGTYKSIELILGYDHKTFSQVVYQSSVSSLEFLTATDTARKKFLIELLNLSAYTKAADIFKELSTQANKLVDVSQAKVQTINSWLTKYEKEDLTPKVLVNEPIAPLEETTKLAQIRSELASLVTFNKKVAQNNTYRTILEGLVICNWQDPVPDKNYRDTLNTQLIQARQTLKEGKAKHTHCASPKANCPTCGHEIDQTTKYEMFEAFKVEQASLEAQIKGYETRIAAFDATFKDYQDCISKTQEVEKYTALVDTTLPTELRDKDALEVEATTLEKQIQRINTAIASAKETNKKVEEHNSKVKVISEQMHDMKKELKEHSDNLLKAMSDLSDLQILVKAFSTTGLVAYKIECLVKDLEQLTNEYLAVLAGGRFQISFQINSSDKLNVIITDNGRDIDITALSSGERARVNVATLLAIRKLMQSLSNSRTNLLILDETVENLDAEGKEKLIEVLLEEENLNTFLISHGFSHPLLEKLHILKENNISRIE
jgi:DNA repair exonuclease SbcCD ATPase subunit